MDVAGELGRGGDLTGSSGSAAAAAASAAAWPSGTGAYSFSSGIARSRAGDGTGTGSRSFWKRLAGWSGAEEGQAGGSGLCWWLPAATAAADQITKRYLREGLVAELESDTAAEVTGLPSPGAPVTVGGAVWAPLVTGMRGTCVRGARCGAAWVGWVSKRNSRRVRVHGFEARSLAAPDLGGRSRLACWRLQQDQ